MKRKRIKQITIAIFGGLLTIAIVIVVCNILVVNNAKGRTFDNLSDVPTRENRAVAWDLSNYP